MKPSLRLRAFLLAVSSLGLAAPLTRAAATWEGMIIPFQAVALSASLPGVIASQPLKEGDALQPGSVITQFNDAEERLTRDRLLQILEKRRSDAEKSSGLFRDKVVTEDEALQARIEFAIAKIDVELAEARLQRRTLAAPFAGVLMKLAYEPGEWVEAGQVVARVARINQLYARILVPAAEAQHLAPDAPALIRFPDLGLPEVRGRIAKIDPQIDVTSGLRRIDILFDNPRHTVIPGARVTVEFTP